MIDMQLLNDALATVALVSGLVILLSAWIVVAAVLAHRHERARGIRQIERLQAAVADQRNSSATK